MTATFEGCGEELIHNLLGSLVVDEASGHDEHVGIVVLADEMCNLGYPAQAGTYLLVLVQRDADALAAATNGNAGINLATLDTFGQCVTKVRLIDRGITPCTVILIRIAVLLKILKYEFLESVACVVTGYAYSLYFHYASSFLT